MYINKYYNRIIYIYIYYIKESEKQSHKPINTNVTNYSVMNSNKKLKMTLSIEMMFVRIVFVLYS